MMLEIIRRLFIVTAAFIGFCGVEAGYGQTPIIEAAGRATETIPAPSTVFQVTQKQVTHVDTNGSLTGTVNFFAGKELRSVSNGVPVRLVRNGRVLERVRTDDSGAFRFNNVAEGVYTIVAADRDLLAVYAVTVVRGERADETGLDLVAVTGLPFQRSLALLASSASPSAVSSALTSDSSAPVFRPETRNVLGTYRIDMSSDGGFAGTITVPGRTPGAVALGTMRGRVIRDGKVIAETQVQQDGKYSFRNIGPGPAGVIFFGGAGFAAMGIELVPSELRAQRGRATTETFVAIQDGAAPANNIDIAPNTDAEQGITDVQESEGEEDALPGVPLDTPPPGFAGGGFGGGGPGGGFGGGGGGAGGGLGGIGGLAAIGAALAAVIATSDDNDNNFVPRPVSPSVP